MVGTLNIREKGYVNEPNFVVVECSMWWCSLPDVLVFTSN